MAGRNAQEAVRNYRAPLQEAVGCVTEPILLLSKRGGYRIGEEYSLILREGDPVQLFGTSRIAVSIAQYFRVVEDERPDYGPVRVTTTAYYYTIVDGNDREVLTYHWHPDAPQSRTPYPHLQLEHGAMVGRPELRGSHIPTGRVALEDFLRLLIEVFSVPPKKDNWDHILGLTKRRFDLYKSW